MGRDRDDDDDEDDDDRDDREDRDDQDPSDDGRGDEEDPADAGENSGRQHRPWAWALSSTVVITLGVWLLASYPGEAREARRYASSARCVPDWKPQTCVELVSAVVERTYKEGFRRPDYYVDLRVGTEARFPPYRQPATVEIEDTGDVYDSLRRGDRVQLGYWGRSIARITKAGVGTVETVESPTFDAGAALGLGTTLPVVGGLSLRFAVRLRRRTGSWRRKGPALRGRPSLPRLLVGGSLAGAVLGTLVIVDTNTYDLGEAVGMWLFTGVVGAVLAFSLWALVRLVRAVRALF